jgi:hypothetical protein
MRSKKNAFKPLIVLDLRTFDLQTNCRYQAVLYSAGTLKNMIRNTGDRPGPAYET